MSKIEHPVMLIVLDGWGHSDDVQFNAIKAADTPTWDRLWNDCPHSLIRCSGDHVGLPDEQMGNSEVGHMHLGAGRKINQDFTRISHAINDGDFFDNQTLKPALSKAGENKKALHILGLLSPGGVHSHEQHIAALAEMAKRNDIEHIYVHAFLDGRDTPPRSAKASIDYLEGKFSELGGGEIASVVGRYFAMDRNNNWDRIAQAYELIVDAKSEFSADSASDALAAAYAREENDEFVSTTSITPKAGGSVQIVDGDVVVFANFRSDRARQLTHAFTTPKCTEFARARRPQLEAFVCMTDYGDQFELPVAFPSIDLPNTFGEWIAARELNQLRIAETEKYAHVTFFFNGGVEKVAAGEDRILIESPDVATYDLKPEMSAAEVTDRLVEAINSRRYDAIVCNYANADMVGHTGDFDATVRCIEALDNCLTRVVAAARASGLEILVTADHGNAEKMREPGSAQTFEQVHTAHTSNLVPLIYIGRPGEIIADGCLSDIAPSMLALMGLDQPTEMTGRTLIKLKDSAQAAA